MLNFADLRLTAAIDYHLDSSDLNSQDDIKKIVENIQETKESTLRVLHQTIEEYNSKIKARQDVHLLLVKQRAALQKRENLQKTLKEKLKTKQISDQKKALDAKIINLYRKNLGFQMERVKSASTDSSEGYSIYFYFQNVNKNNPKDQASLILMTDGTKYKVTNCQPPIATLDEMVSELCESNNLEKFIVEIRRKFCAANSE